MAEAAATAERIETRADLAKGDGRNGESTDAARYAYWMAQEAVAEKEEREWIKRSRDIVKRYRDERPEAKRDAHQFNILWSNVQTLGPTLYARTPKPDVQRRFIDADPTGRLAAILLERSITYSADAFAFDDVMKAVVQDRLLPGRGVARVLYVPYFGKEIEAEKAQSSVKGGEDDNETFEDRQAQAATIANPGDAGAAKDSAPQQAITKTGEEAKDDARPEPGAESLTRAKPLREVDYEETTARYVYWQDYREGPARQWIEVPWVRYRSYLTRDALCERFGDVKGKQVQLDYTPKGMDSESDKTPPDLYKKAIVDEYWDKARKEVIWIAPGTPDVVLDCQDDPLELPGFFPNPDPLLATTTNDSRIPVPDYIEYQDQARELDRLTARIDRLTTALKVSGVYPGETKQELQQLIDADENKLIPIGDWQAWSDKGGLKTFIEWLPIKQIAETLIQLYNARDRVKQVLYEITGLSDILRGQTVPNETLGAQEMKANFATRRISPQQKDAAKHARDLFRLMGQVIAIHFDAKTISLISGYPQLDPVPKLPPQPQMPPQLVQAIIMQRMAAQQQQQPPAQGAMGSPPGGPAPADGGGVPSGAAGAAAGMPSPMMNGGGAAPPPAQGQQPQPQPPQLPPEIQQQMQAFQQASEQWKQAAQAVQAIQQKNQGKQQQFDAAVALLKQDGPHGFRIDIEADSTIAPDEQAEKQARTELLQALLPLFAQVLPIAQGNPAMAEMCKELVLFAMRGFKVARSLEEVVEKAFDGIGKMPPHPTQQPKPQAQAGAQGPHPAEIAAEAAVKGKEIEVDAQSSAHAESTKLAIAQLQASVKQASDDADRRLEYLKVAGEQGNEHARLLLEVERSARESARSDAIASHKASMDASKLQ